MMGVKHWRPRTDVRIICFARMFANLCRFRNKLVQFSLPTLDLANISHENMNCKKKYVREICQSTRSKFVKNHKGMLCLRGSRETVRIYSPNLYSDTCFYFPEIAISEN